MLPEERATITKTEEEAKRAGGGGKMREQTFARSDRVSGSRTSRPDIWDEESPRTSHVPRSLWTIIRHCDEEGTAVFPSLPSKTETPSLALKSGSLLFVPFL